MSNFESDFKGLDNGIEVLKRNLSLNQQLNEFQRKIDDIKEEKDTLLEKIKRAPESSHNKDGFDELIANVSRLEELKNLLPAMNVELSKLVEKARESSSFLHVVELN